MLRPDYYIFAISAVVLSDRGTLTNLNTAPCLGEPDKTSHFGWHFRCCFRL